MDATIVLTNVSHWESISYRSRQRLLEELAWNVDSLRPEVLTFWTILGENRCSHREWIKISQVSKEYNQRLRMARTLGQWMSIRAKARARFHGRGKRSLFIFLWTDFPGKAFRRFHGNAITWHGGCRSNVTKGTEMKDKRRKKSDQDWWRQVGLRSVNQVSVTSPISWTSKLL